MSFHEIDRPDPSKILELPEEAGPALVIAPSAQLFKDEMMFWRARKEEADRAGDATTRLIAQEAIRGFREAIRGRSALELMLGRDIYSAEAAGSWFMSSVLVASHSRLLREIDQLPNHRTSDFSFNNSQVDMAIDFYTSDPYRSGIHVTPDYARDAFAIEPPAPREVRYYEGEAIYLRATSPANSTNIFVGDFRKFYGEPFEPKNYISIVPRLKTDYWISQS